MKDSLFRLLVLALSLFLLPLGASAADADAPRVIVVLDASGSMWGQIDGEAKIDIARKVIGDLVAEWDPKIELGLMAYGHRRKADCEDIELLIPPGKVNAEAFMKVVNAIQPKGKTPLSAAVLQAAEALKFTENRASVILVSDGIETCDMDPCALGKELAEKGVDFKAHVVGFDLSVEEQASIRCLSDKTGGTFLAASDAGELKAALDAAVKEVVEAPAPTPTPTPIPEPPSGAGRLNVTTLVSEGGEEVKAYLRVFEPTANLEGKRRKVWQGSSKKIELEPGKYLVQAEWGKATASREVEIPPGEAVDLTLVLDAGILKVTAFATEGGEQVRGYFYVLSAKQGLDGKRAPVASGTQEFKLPAGDYVVRATWGKVSVETETSVNPGEMTELDVVMEGGVLKLTSSLVEGGEPVKAYYYILESKKDLKGKHAQVTSGSSGQFDLGAGDYIARSTWGKVSVEMPVKVTAGAMEEYHFILGGGMISAKAVAKEGGEPVKGYFYLYDAKTGMSGKRTRITSGSRGEFAVPAGNYIVEVVVDKKKSETEVAVRAGETTEVEIVVSDP